MALSRRRISCLVAAGPDLERQLADLVADGKITTGDADAVREFAEVLRRMHAAGLTDGDAKLK